MSRRSLSIRVLVLGCAVLMLALSALGSLATASSKPAPQEWRIGVAKVGDEVGYRSFNPVGWTTYKVEAPRTLLDAWGNNVTANVVQRLHERSPDGAKALHYLPGSARPFADASKQERSWDLSYNRNPGGDGVEWNYPCLATGRWQGRTPSQLVGTSWADLCDQLWGGAKWEPGAVSAVTVERFQDQDALRMEVRFNAWTFLVYWFAPGEAYPLGVDRCIQPSFCTPDTAQSSLVRVSFSPGHGEPIRWDGSSTDSRRAESDFGEVGARGPPGGAVGTYALDDALARVEDDARLTSFRAWRAAHPDALLVEARLSLPAAPGAGSVPPSASPSWDLTWLARDSSSRRVVTTQDPACAAVPLVLPTSVPCAQNSEAPPKAGMPFPGGPQRGLRLDASLRDALRDHPGESLRTLTWYRPHPDVSLLQLEFWGSGRWSGPIVVFNATSGERMMATQPDLGYEALAEPPARASGATVMGSEARVLAQAALQASTPALTVGGVTLLAILAAPRFPALAVALYSRLTKQDALEHPRRRAILDLLRQQPGLPTGAVAVALHYGDGATRHHLDVLRRVGAITRLDLADGPRWFVPGSVERAQMAREAVLAIEGAEARVLRLVEHAPGIHAAQVARELGVTRPAVHLTLRRLANKGLVHARPDPADPRRSGLFAAGVKAAPDF